MNRAKLLINRFEQHLAETACPDNVCACGGRCGCADRPIARTEGPATSLDALNAMLAGATPDGIDPDVIGEDACCTTCAITGGCCQGDADDADATEDEDEEDTSA